jgi:tetratricopeptide (TPR) repeat protein
MRYRTAIIVISLPFFVYLLTICPTVYLGDSGELTAAAFSLGIPHNSGYPLYAQLGKLFSLVPVGPIGFRMNLMSSLFAVLTVWLVYSLILRITSSKLSAFSGALFLAFVPVLWSQTVSAEVYTLHTFFVALLIRLLWWWDENREFFKIALFVFVTGISFGNHMQTVMLAPAVLFIVLSADYRILSNSRNFLLLSALFLLALSMYVYLPIRTEVGAAIRWGEPNTLDRFIAHVTASAHRESYVLTKNVLEYAVRAKETLLLIVNQFGALLLLALWGWLKIRHIRWKMFFLAVIVFDLVYTVFLNIISFEITPFTLSTCVVLTILIGIGIAHLLEKTRNHLLFGKTTQGALRAAFCMIPVIPLASNLDLCNQSRNYAAYEHVLNIFRTVDDRSTIFLDGDNNIFPVTYGRVVERMREDVTLYDRPNLLFRMPSDMYKDCLREKGENFGRCVERRIVENAQDVYYAVFNPNAVSIPEQFVMYPCGIIHKAVRDGDPLPEDIGKRFWNRYVTESVHDSFHRDFMNRHLCAYFHFSLGQYLFMVGQPAPGLKQAQWASRVGYDDTMIHSDIALLLVDQGFFEEARSELEKALIYYDDLGGVYTNWGHYYYELRDYDEAIRSFRQAVKLDPDNFDHYNNLGLALYQAGRNDEAAAALHQSLAMNRDQPKVETFLQEHGLNQAIVE